MISHKKILLFLIFVGFLTRFFLIPFPGHEHDMAFWKSWSLLAADKGPVELIANGNYYNYPTFFALFMWLFGLFYKLLGQPYRQQYWQTGELTYLLAFKALTLIGDMLIAWLIYRITRPKAGTKKAAVLGLLFWLSPIAIIDSSFWGQVDGLGFLFLLLAIYHLYRQRLTTASFVFTLGCLFKLQNIVFAPIFLIYLVVSTDYKTVSRCLAASMRAFILANLPLIYSQKSHLIFTAFTKNIDYYPYLTLKANNFWALIARDGFWDRWPDQQLLIGAITAKNLGMTAFVISYLVACFLIVFRKNFMLALSLASLGFFTLPTQMHDRYLFSFFPLILIHYAQEPALWPKTKFLLTCYLLLVACYFLNLYASFVFQYQYLGLYQLDNFLNSQTYTIINSCLICLTYLVILVYSLRQLPMILKLTPLLFPLLLLAQNWDYLNHRPIPAANYLAGNWRQSYGSPQKNMTVNSFLGPKNWTRLSNNYFYFDRGIGAHAFSEIYVWINGKFSRFESDYGLDTEASDQAKVIFEIEADGKILFTSDKMGKTDLPKHLKQDINGVIKLTLRIKDTETGINGAHADWLNPVFYK